MHRDFEKVGLICTKLRRLGRCELLSQWDMAHLLLIEHSISKDSHRNERLGAVLSAASNLLGAYEREKSFLLQYEAAGFFIRNRQYSEGLQASILAEKNSHDKNAWIAAHLNGLTCYEALGVEVSTQLEGLALQIRQFRRSIHSSLIEYFQLMTLRMWFRHGDFAKIRRYRGPDILYWHWLKSLPQFHLEQKVSIKPFNASAFFGEGCLFQINTLLFRIEESDMLDVSVNHWCDRLYLWVWSMLKNPERVPISHLYWLLERFSFEKSVDRMTLEDKLMVRNSLEILLLFDPFSRRGLRNFQGPLSLESDEGYPLLSRERRIIEALNAHLTAPRYFRGKKGRLLNWPALKYCGEWREGSSVLSNKIKIDLSLGRIEGARKSWCVCSEDMAAAFEHVLDRKRVGAFDLADFTQVVFNFPHYDSTIHYRRVYNLLVRMSKLSDGNFTFRIRGQTVEFYINSSVFALKRRSELPGFNRDRWRKIVRRISQNLAGHGRSKWRSERSDIKSMFVLHKQRTRRQIQTTMGWPKATTIRRLNVMVEEGMLLKSGQGKSSTYSLKQQEK